jgi:GT2 family glycosyltransferase
MLSEIKPKHIVEIGTAEGKLTCRLLGFASEHDAIVHSVDPLLKIDLDLWKAEHGDRFHFYQMLSLNALAKIEDMDVVLIDGDHNWYAVYHELKLIEKKTEQTGSAFPVVMLHDVGWPYGRRDMYYDPETIPEAYRKPYQYRGISPDSPELVDKGGINPHLANAIYENDLRSGVLTAIEDFQQSSDLIFTFFQVPGFHNLGILILSEILKENKSLDRLISDIVLRYSGDEYIEGLEADRMRAVIKSHDLNLDFSEKEENFIARASELEAEFREKLEKAEESLRTSASQAEELRKSRKAIEEELTEVQQDNQRLMQELSSSKNEKEELLRENRTVRESLNGAIEEKRRLAHELDLAKGKLNKVEIEAEGIRAEMERDIGRLVSWIEDLESGIAGLLSMSRWKVGNKIGDWYQRILRKPSGYTALNLIEDIFKDYRNWRERDQRPPQKKESISRQDAAQTRLPVVSSADEIADRRMKSREPKDDIRIAIYTAISGNYDSIKLPEKLDYRFDYVLFTDTPAPDTGVYKLRPVTYFHQDMTRAARFVKTHPHMMLSDYDIVIWIDSNIMILGDIYPIVEEFLASGKIVASVPHPFRTSIYEEVDACIQLNTEEPETMQEQIAHYRQLDFDCNDLIESSLMMFDLRDKRIGSFLNSWWTEIDQYSRRDQLSLNYALAQNNLEWYPLMAHPTNVRNHPLFARVPHYAGDDGANMLIDALQVSFVDPYAGIPYSDIRDQRIAAQKQRRIDIVVCVHNALKDIKLCLESIRRTRNSEYQRLIIINDGSDETTTRYLQDFTNGVSWIELHRNAHAQGYTKAANQGLMASTGELVILLNSDTIVTDGWTEKMADAVYSTTGAGIVGTMSNAASHQSIPEHRSSKDQTAINALPPGITPDDMNRHCEQWTTASILPRVPLVHGFCFGVTREVISKIGFFDESSFLRGYGEENDYCFRATDAGFSLVIATHTYIFHAKSRSYADSERVLLLKMGAEALERLHGRARIKRSVRSMQDNPILMDLRQQACSLTEFVSSLSTQTPSVSGSVSSSSPRPSSTAKLVSSLSLRGLARMIGKKALVGNSPRTRSPETQLFSSYDVSADILRENWEVIERFRADPRLELNNALWILPSFEHIYRGGIYTIFRVAESFSCRFGTTNTIVLHGGKSVDLRHIETMIREAFPSLKFRLTKVSGWEEVEDLPQSDAAFCTLWTSAYLLVRYNKCKGKFYFIQDFEPAFFPAGSTYGLIEQTYRFGFNGIANTPGVGELYRKYNS